MRRRFEVLQIGKQNPRIAIVPERVRDNPDKASCVKPDQDACSRSIGREIYRFHCADQCAGRDLYRHVGEVVARPRVEQHEIVWIEQPSDAVVLLRAILSERNE